MKLYTVFACIVIASIFLSACGTPTDGQTVKISSDTTCWQCPGGEGADSSRLDRVYSCQLQRNKGSILAGTTATVAANDSGTTDSGGYFRLLVAQTVHLNPIDSSVFALDNQVCWVNSKATNLK